MLSLESMKANTLLAVFLVITTAAFTQSKEFYIEAGSGFFSFTGKTPVKHQNASDWIIARQPYTVPFGRNPGGSFTGGATAKFISKTKWLAGGSLEFQSLCSSSIIDSLEVIGDPAPTRTTTRVDGISRLRINCIALSPFVGKRLSYSRIKIDLTAGFDFALITRSEEKLNMETGYFFDDKRNISTREIDARLRVTADLLYKRFILYLGYRRGLLNYFKRYVGGQPEAYSRFIAAGVGYRLK